MILADIDAGGKPTSMVYRFLAGPQRLELSAEDVSVTAAARDRWAAESATGAKPETARIRPSGLKSSLSSSAPRLSRRDPSPSVLHRK